MKPLTLIAAAFLATSTIHAEDTMPPAEFLSATINLGCVVADIDASMKFYTEAIGFTESGGFHIPADFAKDTGLTDGKKFDVRQLVLQEGAEGATTLKLIQSPDGKSAKAQNDFIDTQLGFSYLTIVVKDTKAALARLEKAGVAPIAQGPTTLPEAINAELVLFIVRDPDGNLIELIGPKTAE